MQFLQQERRLPLPADAHGLITDQVKHPPLYYLALAVATWPGRFEGLSWVPNPHCCNLERPSPAVMRHGEGDRFPYAPAYRLVRRARFLTLLMGLAVVWATWTTARLTLPERPEVAGGGRRGGLPAAVALHAGHRQQRRPGQRLGSAGALGGFAWPWRAQAGVISCCSGPSWAWA